MYDVSGDQFSRSGHAAGMPIIMFWDRSLLAVDVMLRATRDPAFDSR